MASLPPSAIFQVDQLGIKDIDAYGHVWYGNYVKFFTRGARAFLGGGTVRRVEHLKYKKSVPWGAANSRIEAYLVAQPEPGTATLLQRWCVGDEEDNTNALCMMLVELPTGPSPGDSLSVMAGDEKLANSRTKLSVAVKSLQMGGVKPPDPEVAPMGILRVEKHVFADMVAGDEGGNGGRLELVDIMDLFEQSRTDFIGGQPALKAFMDGGKALVVGQIDGLVISPKVRLFAGDTVCCKVTLMRQKMERKCFDFEQILLTKGGDEIARVYVLMCCTDHETGALTSVPLESWNGWLARLADNPGTS